MTRYSAEEKAKMLEGWKWSGKEAWEYAGAIGGKKETGRRQFIEIKPKIRTETQ